LRPDDFANDKKYDPRKRMITADIKNAPIAGIVEPNSKEQTSNMERLANNMRLLLSNRIFMLYDTKPVIE
tara:strand:+ start:405 stop:614 length:210 start_codon:yes stop_codon:yes gene_type:complete